MLLQMLLFQWLQVRFFGPGWIMCTEYTYNPKEDIGGWTSPKPSNLELNHSYFPQSFFLFLKYACQCAVLFTWYNTSMQKELFLFSLVLHTGAGWHAVRVPLKSGHSGRSFFKMSHKSSNEIHLLCSLGPTKLLVIKAIQLTGGTIHYFRLRSRRISFTKSKWCTDAAGK